jgi:hypothetical protein
MNHARLSPSNSRWVKCPGSVREESGYEDTSSAAALDGTGSHILLELCLKNECDAIDFDSKVIGIGHPENISGWFVSLDRIERVQKCIDYIKMRTKFLKETYKKSSVLVLSESSSNPGKMFDRNDWYGTCDITIICTNETNNTIDFLEVIDFKDGRMWVDCKNNSQLLAYLIGKIEELTKTNNGYDISKLIDCRLSIVQPKTLTPIRYQCSTRGDISPQSVIESAESLNESAIKTDDPNAPLTAGKHCQWCKASPKRGGHCQTANDMLLESIMTLKNTPLILSDGMDREKKNGIKENPENIKNFLERILLDTNQLSNNDLAMILDTKEAFDLAFDRCKSEITTRLQSGQVVNGYKMAVGRAFRTWNVSDKEIKELLQNKKLTNKDIQTTTTKIHSPAMVLKCKKLSLTQRKSIESSYVSTISGKDVLKRVEKTNITQSVDEMFKDVISEDMSNISFLE